MIESLGCWMKIGLAHR